MWEISGPDCVREINAGAEGFGEADAALCESATPATGAFSGMPASKHASEPPQIDAIDDEPFDSRISETMRIVYGNSSNAGSTAWIARSASAP